MGTDIIIHNEEIRTNWCNVEFQNIVYDLIQIPGSLHRAAFKDVQLGATSYWNSSLHHDSTISKGGMCNDVHGLTLVHWTRSLQTFVIWSQGKYELIHEQVAAPICDSPNVKLTFLILLLLIGTINRTQTCVSRAYRPRASMKKEKLTYPLEASAITSFALAY